MKIKVCPHCGSRNIHLHMGAELGVLYKCEDCGYTGPIIAEYDIERKLKEKK